MQASQVQVSRSFGVETTGEMLGVVSLFCFFNISEKHVVKSTSVKFSCTISSELNRGCEKWMQGGMLSVPPQLK